MQSILPLLSSLSLASQLMGCVTRVTPIFSQTFLATSMSKPTTSIPFSERKPMGGKLSSRPRVNTPLSFTFCRESSVAPDGVKVVGTIDLSSPNHSLLIADKVPSFWSSTRIRCTSSRSVSLPFLNPMT